MRRERPADEDALRDVVRRAASDGLVVRPVGSGHSFSPLCVTDGVQVDLSAMNQLLSLDPATGVARVQAGMTLRDLSIALHARGRALENLGDIDQQTVAGALATATHGTGAAFGNLSTTDGRWPPGHRGRSVLDLTDPSEPDLLLAARVSLGSLGVLSEVSLETVPHSGCTSARSHVCWRDVLAGSRRAGLRARPRRHLRRPVLAGGRW